MPKNLLSKVACSYSSLWLFFQGVKHQNSDIKEQKILKKNGEDSPLSPLLT